MFIVNKSQDAKFQFLAIKFTDRLVGSQLAKGSINKKMNNEGLIADIQKKAAIWDPKDALHYFCILHIIFANYTVLNYSFFDIKCIGFVTLNELLTCVRH